MNLDLNAIATALALRYDPINLAPPAGEPAIIASTALLPNAIEQTPMVTVMFAPDQAATFQHATNARLGTIPFVVDLLLEKADELPAQMLRLQKWAGVLLDANLAALHLGIPSVVNHSWAGSLRLGDIEYAGQKFAAVRLVVNVRTADALTPTA